MRRLVPLLRDSHWLTPERARGYAVLLLAIQAALALAWVLASSGGVDPTGKAVGTDFLSFWTASALALGGAPAAAYDVAAHRAAELAVFDRDVGYAAFFYPPPFLLLCWPLALVPYGAALAAWLLAGGAAFVATVRGVLRGQLGFMPVLAFPAVLSNLGHGQNGFVTASLLGGAALLLGRRPILAGCCVGALVVKPHLALLLPLGLLFVGAWRTIAAAAATAVGLALLSLLAFGVETWRAFLLVSPLARAALEDEWVGSAKMQSAFAAARLLGAGLAPAYAVQLLAAGCALTGLWRLARARVAPETYGVALAAAALLGSPFLLDYDLTVLAIPLAWLAREAIATGFRPWERIGLAAGFVLPLVARLLATGLGLPLGSLVVAGVFALVVRRAVESDRVPQRTLKGSPITCPA